MQLTLKIKVPVRKKLGLHILMSCSRIFSFLRTIVPHTGAFISSLWKRSNAHRFSPQSGSFHFSVFFIFYFSLTFMNVRCNFITSLNRSWNVSFIHIKCCFSRLCRYSFHKIGECLFVYWIIVVNALNWEN